jgi:hypothetical protein
MISLFDTLSLERALSLPLDRKLRHMLGERVRHLNTQADVVREATYFLVVEAGSTMADVCDELGWSPVHDLDAEPFGTDAFTPFHDYLEDRGGWFELMIGAGNDAVFVLFVQDDERTPADLLSFCRTYAN